jgi:antibiotic biosynthesis monooxygenase (ABM) superfamily enzyme
MNDPRVVDNPGDGGPRSVAFIITHTIRAGEEERYESWLADIFQASSSYPGYLGRQIFRPAPAGRKYTSILRFDNLDNLNGWAGSDTRSEFISRVADLLEQGDDVQIRTGLDFWFTPETVKPPKRWKQFALTVSAVYPLSLLIPLLVLRPLIKLVPLLGHNLIKSLIMAITLTGMLTFVIMPNYTRLVKRWLFERNE